MGKIKGSAMLVELLAQAGLIDGYDFLVHPAIVGSGKRFFNDEMALTKLVESKTLSSGVLALTHEPIE
ncbi:MAG: dihydrofolate reductase family protein [Anaerolineales bacterium]